MPVSKYVSDVKVIPHNNEVVFNYLSDFDNLSKYLSDEVISAISGKIPGISIKNFESDHDSCRFEISGMGNAEIRIVERTPFTTIKIDSQGGLPVEMKLWIQLLPLEDNSVKMRLTLQAEMSMMIKMMVGNKLEVAINQLADALAVLPYDGH